MRRDSDWGIKKLVVKDRKRSLCCFLYFNAVVSVQLLSTPVASLCLRNTRYSAILNTSLVEWGKVFSEDAVFDNLIAIDQIARVHTQCFCIARFSVIRTQKQSYARKHYSYECILARIRTLTS